MGQAWSDFFSTCCTSQTHTTTNEETVVPAGNVQEQRQETTGGASQVWRHPGGPHFFSTQTVSSPESCDREYTRDNRQGSASSQGLRAFV
uniref:Uncharacterized protein n=1 Tax=Chromera velia CCMP2878 TaxID=1169474 RepID=A0A0G4H8V7_9ALVE|eukprot:Cvel_25278.t1-p1 / transcript=Cvel_25278.t1 / gene=Cvel_25278 / organism=Chromera_velia_CCMP2878 / gene_product=hypothetical protein / transcript_product=hypothetical protein / location=Cvel_scaffold2839:6601-8209(+) / protein_length=89 / sequence_SO=supercontig / SO=protein_coding / is_pseudo=false